VVAQHWSRLPFEIAWHTTVFPRVLIQEKSEINTGSFFLITAAKNGTYGEQVSMFFSQLRIKKLSPVEITRQQCVFRQCVDVVKLSRHWRQRIISIKAGFATVVCSACRTSTNQDYIGVMQPTGL